MKKLLISSVAGLFLTTAAFAQVDRSSAPEPGPAPKPVIGKYEQFTLSNGLTVFVVENHKVPRVVWRLSLDVVPQNEGEKAGISEIMGQMLEAGTVSTPKEKLNEEVDFLGASINFYSEGAYGVSLSKHAEKLLALMSDNLLNPAFPAEELEKLKVKTSSELKSSENDPSAIASRAGAAIRYGSHPYGESMTPATLENITIDDLKKYHSTWFRPNRAYLAIVGDITAAEAKPLVEKYLGNWERKDINVTAPPAPGTPTQPMVTVVDKAGAVQSTVNVHYPVDLKPGSHDAMVASVMANILGGSGFSGRLMQNLREDKAYTYGSYCSLSADTYVGSFNAYASVRNEVTDSAVQEILYEMRRMIDEPVSEKDLRSMLNEMSGGFARSLENPQTLANFAINIARHKLPADHYDTYLERLNKITPEDVQAMAKKYLKPENAIIQVVGNKGEVSEKLARFSPDGKVLFFDPYGKPARDLKPAPEGLTAKQVMENHINAIGGVKRIAKVKSFSQTSNMTITGAPVKLTMYTAKSGTDKLAIVVKMGEQVFQKQVINGNAGLTSGMMGKQEMGAEEIAKMKESISVAEEIGLAADAGRLSLMGIEEINGQDAYKVEIKEKDGTSSYSYYSVATGLKVRSVGTTTQGEGEAAQTITVQTDVLGYSEVGGVKFPSHIQQSMGPQSFEITATETLVNPKLDKTTFDLK
jgi:predicted Zn-dependent peptidase/uncharacterized membrane protein YkoI